jgi:glycosyltransferase involved in cell wall biosynthesis
MLGAMAPPLNPPGRRRVLLLVDRLDDVAGGGERTVLTIATMLPADRYDVVVVTSRLASGAPIRRLDAAGIRHVHLDRRGRLGLRGLRRLGRLLRAEGTEVLHAHMFGSNVWGTLVGRLAGVPVVIAHEHSWPFAGQPVRRVLDHLIGRFADAFIAVSQTDRALMIRMERIRPDKIHVIPSGWTPGTDTGGDLRQELGLGPDVPIVGTVAVMRPVKRLELLIEAFARVAAVAPEARLVFGGDGECRPGLEALAAELGLADRIHFLGMRDDVAVIWRAIDVGVICSDREGSPVAAMEAMAGAVPMVATAVGGMAEVIVPGETGQLVPAGDVQALADAITALVGDPERRREMGAAAERRSAGFTAERQVQRIAELYEDRLVARRAARAQRCAARLPRL